MGAGVEGGLRFRASKGNPTGLQDPFRTAASTKANITGGGGRGLGFRVWGLGFRVWGGGGGVVNPQKEAAELLAPTPMEGCHSTMLFGAKGYGFPTRHREFLV